MIERVGDIDEERLLARIVPLLPVGSATLVGSGDDAALVGTADGRFVVTTDVLVEDRHFRRRWSSGDDVGWRAAAANLADVAAMGAVPTAIVVSLVLPADLPVDWVVGCARGLAEACAPRTGVVGGDLSSGPVVVLAVTAHGDLEGRSPLLRSGARVGDVVAHAGVCGTSAAGLALLSAGVVEVAEPGEFAGLVAGYLRPQPPLAAGPLAARSGATALMDVSDGLLRDAGRMARASGVAIDLSATALADEVERLLPAAGALAGAAPALGAGDGDSADAHALAVDWVLAGGEDHGLLATFPPESPMPALFRVIGRVVPAGASAVLVDGGVPPTARTGWDHFGPSRSGT